jgi:hypothetical protein
MLIPRSFPPSPPRSPRAQEFGKFGVIREADADRKRSEFMAWALDVKKLDAEALAKWEEKELFREFVEDFNTGTLPHRWAGDKRGRRRPRVAPGRGWVPQMGPPGNGIGRPAFQLAAACPLRGVGLHPYTPPPGSTTT